MYTLAFKQKTKLPTKETRKYQMYLCQHYLMSRRGLMMNMTLYVGIFMIIFDNYNLDATVIERNTFDSS
jgi:hypothetical protein